MATLEKIKAIIKQICLGFSMANKNRTFGKL
jgi:hypothetical protein